MTISQTKAKRRVAKQSAKSLRAKANAAQGIRASKAKK